MDRPIGLHVDGGGNWKKARPSPAESMGLTSAQGGDWKRVEYRARHGH